MSAAATLDPAGASSPADREIVLTRAFDAPRELVFAVWTGPEHVGHWWGPRGFTITTHQMDVRVGGVWRFTMHGPDGTDYPNRITFREIVAPERLLYGHGSDVDDDPGEFEVTVTFTEEDGKTRVTSRMLFSTAAQREASVGFGAIELGNQTMERLGEYLGTL